MNSISMKLIKILSFFIVLNSCNSKKSSPELTNFNYLAVNPKSIIVSCNKCGCVIDELNKYFGINNFDTTVYKLYGDTSCLSSLSKKIQVSHIDQHILDSISINFYNLLIITKRNENSYSQKMVTTDEATNLSKYLKN